MGFNANERCFNTTVGAREDQCNSHDFSKEKDCGMTRQVTNVSDRALAVDTKRDFYGLLKPLALQAPLQALRFFLLAATVKPNVGQTLRA